MTLFERAVMFGRSFLLQSAFGPERMQALGFAWALDPWLVKLWGHDATALAEARKRHLGCFNTNPYAVGFLLGMTCRLEEEAAAAPAAARAEKLSRLAALKGAASAGLAGAADAFFWGALRPALAFAALVLGFVHFSPLLIGAYLLAWNAPALWARWKGLAAGYAGGEKAVLDVCKIPAAEASVTLRFSALGLGAAAALVASHSDALNENARLLGGIALLLAVFLPERVGPWGVAGAVGVVRAVWEAGI